MSRTAVVLVNLGGPADQDAVEPFLANLFSDVVHFPWGRAGSQTLGRFLAGRRRLHSQGLYEKIGGGSPILAATRAQADALKQALGDGYDIRVAMRYSPPMIGQVQQELAKDGGDWEQVIVLPLFPQYSFATTRTCREAWERDNPLTDRSVFIHSYHDHPDYIAAVQELIRQTLASREHSADTHIVFSAHSVPVSYIRKGDVYQRQIEETVAKVMEGLPNPHSLAYQSKVGPVKWVGPATRRHVQELAAQGIKHIAAVPIAFVCEHLETLYELDILVKDIALQGGVTQYVRVPAVGAHPRFISALADIVQNTERYTAQ